jgi:outer membrane protein OmpA-like peptidoglycan-associated protein
MPPPRNGSLGRGLGDLLGGVPETIGVAGAPPVLANSGGIPPPHPAAEPVGERTEQVPVMVAGKPCWTPARCIMAFSAGLVLVLMGAGIGIWTALRTEQSPSLATSVIVVTNTVTLPPELPQPKSVVDMADLNSLKGIGILAQREKGETVRVMFEAPVFSSRVVLDPDQRPVLQQLGKVLAKHSGEWTVRIVGHTDSVPIRGSGLYRDNKELGLARAMEVMRVLCREADVPASMMVAATAGDENSPFAGNDPEASRKNRTVTLVIGLSPQ